MKNMDFKKPLAASILILAITGCATDKEALTALEASTADAKSTATDAKDTATRALETAKSAQGSADSARSTAEEALETARLALENSERNRAAIDEINEKIDRMFKKTMHK